MSHREQALRAILSAAADEFGLEPNDLRTRSRKPDRVEAMWLFVWVARRFEGMRFTQTELGRFLDRDSTTILHAERQYARLVRRNESERRRAKALLSALQDGALRALERSDLQANALRIGRELARRRGSAPVDLFADSLSGELARFAVFRSLRKAHPGEASGVLTEVIQEVLAP